MLQDLGIFIHKLENFKIKMYMEIHAFYSNCDLENLGTHKWMQESIEQAISPNFWTALKVLHFTKMMWWEL